MAGINLASQVTYVTPTEFIVAAQTTTEHGAVAKNLMQPAKLPKGKGRTLQLPHVGQLTAAQFTRGSSIEQYQQFSMTKVSMSPIWIAVHMTVDEEADMITDEDLNMLGGQLMGEAIVRFEDKDCLDLGDGFSNSTGAGGTIKAQHLFDANAFISGNTTEPVPPPFYAVVHPYQYNAMAADLAGFSQKGWTDTTANLDRAGDGAYRDRLLATYQVGNIADMKVYKAGNLTITGGVAKGYVAARKALVHGVYKELKKDEKWDPGIQGTHVYFIYSYFRGEWLDTGGVELNGAATSPV